MQVWESLRRTVSGVFTKSPGDITRMDVKSLSFNHYVKYHSSSSLIDVDLSNYQDYVAEKLPPLLPISKNSTGFIYDYVLPAALYAANLSTDDLLESIDHVSVETAKKPVGKQSTKCGRKSFRRTMLEYGKSFRSLLADNIDDHLQRVHWRFLRDKPGSRYGLATFSDEDSTADIDEEESKEYNEFLALAHNCLEDESTLGALLYIWTSPTVKLNNRLSEEEDFTYSLYE